MAGLGQKFFRKTTAGFAQLRWSGKIAPHGSDVFRRIAILAKYRDDDCDVLRKLVSP
jgi:hypothetical protein